MFKQWLSTFPPNVNKTNLSHHTTYAKSLVYILMEIQVLRWDMYKTVAGLKWLMGSKTSPLSLSNGNANTKRVRNKNNIHDNTHMNDNGSMYNRGSVKARHVIVV